MRVTTEKKDQATDFNYSRLVKIIILFGALVWLLNMGLMYGLEAKADPSLDYYHFNKRNEVIDVIMNISNCKRAEVYIEYAGDIAIIDISIPDYLANQTAPLVESYTINYFMVGDNSINFDVTLTVDKAIQRDIDRIVLCLYDEAGGLYLYELF